MPCAQNSGDCHAKKLSTAVLRSSYLSICFSRRWSFKGRTKWQSDGAMFSPNVLLMLAVALLALLFWRHSQQMTVQSWGSLIIIVSHQTPGRGPLYTHVVIAQRTFYKVLILIRAFDSFLENYRFLKFLVQDFLSSLIIYQFQLTGTELKVTIVYLIRDIICFIRMGS